MAVIITNYTSKKSDLHWKFTQLSTCAHQSISGGSLIKRDLADLCLCLICVGVDAMMDVINDNHHFVGQLSLGKYNMISSQPLLLTSYI